METTALSIKHIAEMHCVNGNHFTDLYRNKISGYTDWCDNELSCCSCFNAANFWPHMSLDVTCLSNGEVWTFLTNKDGHEGKGTLATSIPGTKVQLRQATDFANILQRRGHAADSVAQQTHADDVAEPMDRHTASSHQHSVQAPYYTQKNHAPTILNYVRRHATNVSAEAFKTATFSSFASDYDTLEF